MLFRSPVAHTLPGYEATSRLAIFAPAGTQSAIVTRLNREIVRILNQPDIRRKFHESYIETVGDTPEALAALIKADISRTARIVKEAGIRAD